MTHQTSVPRFADFHDVTVHFKDSGHANDKRKRSHAGCLDVSALKLVSQIQSKHVYVQQVAGPAWVIN